MMSLMFDRKTRAIAHSIIGLAAASWLGFVPGARAMMPPLDGPIPPAVAQAVREGVFASESIPATGPMSHVNRGSRWHIPVILVSFSDEPLAFDGGTFQHLLFDTTGTTATGSVFDYFRWASAGRLTVTGRVVATVRLSQPQSFYAGATSGLRSSTPNNSFGATRDALRACADTIDWRPFDVDLDGVVDVVWVVHAGVGAEATGNVDDLWSVTARMSRGWRESNPWYTKTPYAGGSPGQMLRIDLFAMLPERSTFVEGRPSEIGVFCHEFGHALGLPDLYSTDPFQRGNSGPGHWSLMGSGGYGGDGRSPQYPTHLGAWPLKHLGWDRTVQPSQDATITLEPLVGTGAMVDWSFQGETSNDHFLIEYRTRTGFDRNLPHEGLIVYHLDDATIHAGLEFNAVNAGSTPGLRIVEADGHEDLVTGLNRGDANDPFPGALLRTAMDDGAVRPNTRTFANAPTGLAIRDIQRVGDRMRFHLQVRAPGWQPVVDASGAGYVPVETRSVARQNLIDSRGVTYQVDTELRAGRLQVVLRRGAGVPGEAIQVSQSPSGAFDPTIALLPGDHLAIVWTDTRQGRAMLYYRSFVSGVWSEERLLVQKVGECSHASIVSSRRGTIALAFRYTESNRSQIQFMRFTYFSPFGTPIPVTPLASAALQPSVVDADQGSTVILWSDRSQVVPRLMFARHHPDSGVTPPMPLTAAPLHEQTAPSPIIDSLGTLHVAWQVMGPGRNEIHYQRRPFSSAPAPAETAVVIRNESVGRPVLSAGSAGLLHLAFEAANGGITQIRYKRHQPGHGWDAHSTEVTTVADGASDRPRLYPAPSGDIVVTYTGFSAGSARLLSRRRGTTVPAPLEVPPAVVAGPFRLDVGPNPLLPGQRLALRWTGGGPAPEGFDLFDVGGRRVARIDNPRPGGTGFVVPADLSGRWSSGVYFLRPRSVAGTPIRVVVIR
jgi:immune inhibitor A